MRSKLFGLVSLTLLGIVAVATGSSSQQHFEMYKTASSKSIKAPREVKKGHFGATEITEISEENNLAKIKKSVYSSNKDFVRDYER